MTTRPVAVRVSQATRLAGSSDRQASRMASEIWSASLSGWPSVTDSDVKRVGPGAPRLAITCALPPPDKVPTPASEAPQWPQPRRQGRRGQGAARVAGNPRSLRSLFPGAEVALLLLGKPI